MRAWLLLLAVLATFLTIVQVASTEDNNNISSSFITAIKPITKDLTTKTTTAIVQKPTSTALIKLVDYKDTLNTEQKQASVYKTYKQSENFNETNLKNYKNNKMKSEIEHKNLQQSQKSKHNHIEEETISNKNKESSSKHENHKHYHQQKQHHQHHQHQNYHNHQHQQQQQQNLQPASQQPANTTISDNLALTTASMSSMSSSLSSLPSSSSTTSSSLKLELEVTVTEDDDGAIVVESHQPQLDAVIPDEGPRTFSNQEIIAEKVEPAPSTLVQIENSLLSLFNMKRPPKIDRSKIVIPPAMKELYAQMMGHKVNSANLPKLGLLTKSANTVRSFTHQDSKIDDRFPHHHRFRLYFDIKSIPTEEKLKAAELQLTRDAISHATLNPRLANRTLYQVLVYDITRTGVRGKREPRYLLLDNKTIRLNSTDTVSLDVQPAVDRWLASPKRNFGLLVEVRTSRSHKPAPIHHVRLRRSADENHTHWQHKQPLLFTYTDDGRHKARSIHDVSTRSKRAGGHHRRSQRRKNSDEICRRHALYVDFADVGWSDWIVAPPGYDAFYCHGRCPFPIAEHLNSTNHAVVQTLVNSISPEKVPKACCVPTQLEGISMLYLNDRNSVVLKNYQDMTVVGCGCR